MHTHNISAEAKTARNLLQHVMADIKYAEKEYEVTIAAWCTDAAGDAKKMRKDLVKQMPWIISLDCAAHQVNLVVCDLFKLKSAYLKTIDKATEVIKWFNHHSHALGLLRKEQLGTYQKILALIQPVITRWTCHFLSTRRLLETSGALRSCCIKEEKELEKCGGDRQQDKAKARQIIQTVLCQNIWPLRGKLTRLITVISFDILLVLPTR